LIVVTVAMVLVGATVCGQENESQQRPTTTPRWPWWKRNGDLLLQACSEALVPVGVEREPNRYLFGFCEGFMEGVIRTNGLLAAKGMTPMFCGPTKVEATDDSRYTIRVIVDYLNEHPEELGADASVLVVKAMNGEFPCEPTSGD